MTVAAVKKANKAAQKRAQKVAKATKTAKKVPAKTVGKKTAAKKTPAKKVAVKKTAKTTAAKKAAPPKPAARKAPAKKAPAKKSASKKAPAKKTAAKKAAVKKAPVKKATKKAPAKKAAAKTLPGSGTPRAVGGERWTPAELKRVKAELQLELAELDSEYAQSLEDLHSLQLAAVDGAGDDQADAGTKSFERQQELWLAHNRFDLITQVRHALERLDSGTYGRCESCGNPIAKARLQAFPSATLCVTCKQREERR